MGRRTIGFVSVLALIAAVPACQSAGPTDPPSVQDGKILFVGNSLTYFNDLPSIVAAMADSVGSPLTVGSVTYGGFSLEDHWNAGTAPATIRLGGWSMVVLQQGPSSLEESRVNLRTWTRRFADLIAAEGGRPALYQVWPSQDRPQDFDRASESYAIAAADVNGMLLPGGEAWRAAWRIDPTLQFYSSDGLHPTPLGSYLVAMVMVTKLTGKPASALPAAVTLESGQTIGASTAVAATLRTAVASLVPSGS